MSFGGSSSESNQWSEAWNKSQSVGGSQQEIFGGQLPFLENLWQGGQNVVDNISGPTDTAPFLERGNAMLDQVQGLTDWQGQVDAQMESLTSGLSDFWNQGRNNIASDAVTSGAFGGARHGVAEASLGGEISQALVQGKGDIMANARNQAMQAAGLGTQMGNSLFNLGEAGRMAEFAPLQAMAGLLGPAITLGNSFNLSQSEGEAISSGSSDSNKLSLGFK
ncbi:hypothetical protein [Ruegeria sp. HKCCE4148]|uniref:hypothetical protein n=1 Tax=Ruegeria sp. HKCCE4148 TaxID=2794829 RepID=UPI001AEAFD9B|nr:hypothetical protein [Ruegeria sp. HKCCE4148]